MQKFRSRFILISIICLTTTGLSAEQSDKSNKKSFDITATIDKSFRRMIAQYFLEIQNLSKSQKNMESFILKAFFFRVPPTPKEKAEIKKLDSLSIPKVVLITDGLEFEFENSARFTVTFGKNLGEINIGEIKKHAVYEKSSEKESFALFMQDLHPLPSAYGYVATIARGALWLYRLVVGKSLKVTATSAVVGAAAGCVVGMKLNNGENTAAEDCEDGALNGGTILSIIPNLPYIDNKVVALIDGTIKFNPFVSRSLQVAGVLGTMVMGYQAHAAIQEMDGTILRCQGIDAGDFIFSAKVGGITRQTLYEVHKGQLMLNIKDKNIVVPISSSGLVDYLNEHSEFKNLPESVMVESAKVMLSEISTQIETCKKNGNGYTKSNTKANSTVKIIESKDKPTETK